MEFLRTTAVQSGPSVSTTASQKGDVRNTRFRTLAAFPPPARAERLPFGHLPEDRRKVAAGQGLLDTDAAEWVK